MAGMKRTREEYSTAIKIIDEGTWFGAARVVEPALDAMREMRDSAFALDEALVNLTGKAEAMLDRYERLVNSGDAGFWNPYEEKVVINLMMALQVAKIAQAAIAPDTAQEGVAAPAPAAPSSSHQSEEIMDNGEPEKFTGPSSDLPDAGNSTPGV